MKDNANPIIHSVSVSRRKERKPLTAFQRWQQQPGGPQGQVLQALVSVQQEAKFTKKKYYNNNTNNNTTNGNDNDNWTHVKLLCHTGGLQLPNNDTSSPLVQGPCFVPSIQLRLQQKKQQQQQLFTVEERELIDADDVFDIIRNIQDPEHPLTLEQLNVVHRDHVTVHDNGPFGESDSTPISSVHVRFTPTIPHCSMATLIGLALRVKLGRSLPVRFTTISVQIQPGTHASEHAINKQLTDKERVTAALENSHLLGVVNKCIGNGMTGNMQD